MILDLTEILEPVEDIEERIALDYMEDELVITDAGGPGRFRFDGGPKPYIKKKTGKPSPAAQAKITAYNKAQHQGKVRQAETRTQAAKQYRQQTQQAVLRYRPIL